MCDLSPDDYRTKLDLPFIYRDEYKKLSKSKRSQIEYSNPCSTNDPNILRVGQVFDDDLGYWRKAYKSDF